VCELEKHSDLLPLATLSNASADSQVEQSRLGAWQMSTTCFATTAIAISKDAAIGADIGDCSCQSLKGTTEVNSFQRAARRFNFDHLRAASAYFQLFKVIEA
jgi:hypothetical protein